MNLRVDEIDGSEFAHLVEVRDDSEWVLATVYPGTQISHPIRPEVRALSAKRARMVESALALAPLVDRWLAARTLCEHFQSDEGCSVEDFTNVERALGALR